MSDAKPRLERLTTGIPALDGILGGGFPTGSSNIVAGGPGAGKSTLALQILFHQARQGNRGIYFVTTAEPAIKFLRYMQEFEFFDSTLVGKTVFLLDLSGPVLSQGVEKAIETIKQRVQEKEPALVVIDSFKSIRQQLPDPGGDRSFLYDLAVSLTVSEATTLLVGEYTSEEIQLLPEFAVVDGIIYLTTVAERLRAIRQLEVLKLRASPHIGGRHFFDIGSAGLSVYPRINVPPEHEIPALPPGSGRLSTGVPALDGMLGGGIPPRTTTLIEGGTGTGKTVLALTFLVEGARRGERGLLLALEETREQLHEMGAARGWELDRFDREGLLRILYVSPLEVSADALLYRAQALIEQWGTKRVVVDSITSLNMSIAAEGRFRALVYALVKTCRARGASTILTSEIPELIGTATLTGHGVSSIADNIILLRYVEIESHLTAAISVLKVRGSAHQKVLRELQITADSVSIRDPFQQYRGVLTGVPTPAEKQPRLPRRPRVEPQREGDPT